MYNIYTSNIVNTTAGIIITDLSDHFGVFLIEQNTQKNAHTKIPEYKRIRKFNDSNMNIFRNSLGQHDFIDVFMSTCPDEAYDKSMQILKTTYDQAFPSHLIRLTKKDYKRDPWITHGLEKSAKTKQKLYKNKLRNPTQSNIERYKAYNRIYNKVKRLKKKYYEDKINDNKSNIKETWKIIKQLITKTNNKLSYPDHFKFNNKLVSDKNEISELFNDFFCKYWKKTLTTQYQKEEKHTINICRLMFETQCTYPQHTP